jgi:hypothetical protein
VKIFVFWDIFYVSTDMITDCVNGVLVPQLWQHPVHTDTSDHESTGHVINKDDKNS